MKADLYYHIPNYSEEFSDLYLKNGEKLNQEDPTLSFIKDFIYKLGNPTKALTNDTNMLKVSYLSEVGFLVDITSSSLDVMQGAGKMLVLIPEKLVSSYWPDGFPEELTRRIIEEIRLTAKKYKRPFSYRLNQYLDNIFFSSLRVTALMKLKRAIILFLIPFTIGLCFFLIFKSILFIIIGLTISLYSLVSIQLFDWTFYRYLSVLIEE